MQFFLIYTNHWNITVRYSNLKLQLKTENNRRNPLLTGISYIILQLPNKNKLTTINDMVNYP